MTIYQRQYDRLFARRMRIVEGIRLQEHKLKLLRKSLRNLDSEMTALTRKALKKLP